MVTPEEQRTLQLENAEADERFWDGLHDMHQESAEGHKQLAANAERKVTENEAAIANATAKKAEAKKRIEGLKKGEDVAGGLSRLSYKECLKLLGWNASDVHNEPSTRADTGLEGHSLG